MVVYILGSAVPTTTKERCPAIPQSGEDRVCAKSNRSSRHSSSMGEAQIGARHPVGYHREFKNLPLYCQVTSNDMYATMLAWPAPGDDDAAVQLSSICPAMPKVRLSSKRCCAILAHAEILDSTSRSTASSQLDWFARRQSFTRASSNLTSKVFLLDRLTGASTEPCRLNFDSPRRDKNRVYNILDGLAETENILHRDIDPETGFVLTPDLFVLHPHLASQPLLTDPLTQQKMGPNYSLIHVPTCPHSNSQDPFIERSESQTFATPEEDQKGDGEGRY